MTSLPEPIGAYLNNLFVRGRSPAFLCVNDNGRLSCSGGDVKYYHLNELHSDIPVDDQIPVLLGLFPLRQDRLILPMIQLAPDRFAEIHVFGGKEETFILFLDQSQEAREAQRTQQVSNELALLREKHQRLLDQYIGREMTEELVSGHARFHTQGERRALTVLFADIRGFTSFSAANPPERVFKTLNLYLEAMILSILRENGVVDKIIGDGVMALFGVLPGTHSARNAIQAAQGIQDAVRELRSWNVGKEANLRGVGVGIASGVLTLGVIGVQNRRSFTAIGHSVNLAARLQSQACPGEILLDESTLHLLPRKQSQLTAKVMSLKGIAKPVTAYSLTTL